MPPHGAIYRSAIARMFRQCGKGKALFFEESRFVGFAWVSILEKSIFGDERVGNDQGKVL